MLDLCEQLLAHEVEDHGDDGEAEQEVDRAEDHLGVALHGGHRGRVVVDVAVAGHEVAEADGHEAGEAEVCAVQDGPALPDREERGAEHDVAEQHEEAGGDGHRHQAQVLHQLELDRVLLQHRARPRHRQTGPAPTKLYLPQYLQI